MSYKSSRRVLEHVRMSIPGGRKDAARGGLSQDEMYLFN